MSRLVNGTGRRSVPAADRDRLSRDPPVVLRHQRGVDDQRRAQPRVADRRLTWPLPPVRRCTAAERWGWSPWTASINVIASFRRRRATASEDRHRPSESLDLKRRSKRRAYERCFRALLTTFDATSRAVRAAIEIVQGATGLGLGVRVGVHTGEIEVRPDDVLGLPVSIAKRICDLDGPGQVFVSENREAPPRRIGHRPVRAGHPCPQGSARRVAAVR